jgi:hypothetical protein
MSIKKISLFSFAAAPFVLCLGVAVAQQQPATAPQNQADRPAQQVKLAVPFGVVNGQLVISGQNLMFVDGENPSGSFVVPRNDVRNVNTQADQLTFDLSRPVQDSGGQTSRLVFRLDNPSGAQQFVQWFRQTTAGEANRTAENPQQESMSFQVKHDHFIGSDRGRLMITPTQIVYESVSNVNDSRQWNMSDIKEVHRDGPYKIKITPFTGDDYSFEMLGQGMTSDQYQTLVERVTNARVNRH